MREILERTSEEIREDVNSGHVVLNADFIPDEDTEVYFKAADAVILPYRQIYQSGVLFLDTVLGCPFSRPMWVP